MICSCVCKLHFVHYSHQAGRKYETVPRWKQVSERQQNSRSSGSRSGSRTRGNHGLTGTAMSSGFKQLSANPLQTCFVFFVFCLCLLVSCLCIFGFGLSSGFKQLSAQPSTFLLYSYRWTFNTVYCQYNYNTYCYWSSFIHSVIQQNRTMQRTFQTF